jgi:hypothetical protein
MQVVTGYHTAMPIAAACKRTGALAFRSRSGGGVGWGGGGGGTARLGAEAAFLAVCASVFLSTGRLAHPHSTTHPCWVGCC